MSNDALVTAAQNAVRAINSLNRTMDTVNQTLNRVLPAVQSVSTSATAGAATLPATPEGFLDITLPDGTSAKVPYYLP
jgi:hypothetical protein